MAAKKDGADGAKRKSGKREEVDDFDRAAESIWAAEFLVVFAGPNFNEDFSKTAFAEPECHHELIAQPNKFFGFWGKYYNRYQDKNPLEAEGYQGYSVLRRWRDNYFDSRGVDQRKRQKAGMGKKRKDDEEEGEAEKVLQRIYVITANIDGYFDRSGFHEEELYEINGNTSNWQCSRRCENSTFRLEPSFRFKIDEVLKEALPIKMESDIRPDVAPESFEIVNEELEGDCPLVVTHSHKKQREMNPREKERHEMDTQRRFLYRCSPIPVKVELQFLRELFLGLDHFMPAPASSHCEPRTHTFFEFDVADKPKLELDAEGEQKVEEKAPEQPYILKQRISHYYAHVMALCRNQYAFHEGVFALVNPQEETERKERVYTEMQRFFEEKVPGETEKRKKHIFYCVSMFIQDDSRPTLKDPMSAQAGVDALGGFGAMPPKPVAAEASPTAGAATPTLPPLDASATVNPGMLGTSLYPPTHANSISMGDSWEQGKDGRYYFSYVPIQNTMKDPFNEDHRYDHMMIPFPPLSEDAPDTLPKKGKVSIVVECCIMPEKVAKEGGGKKGKDEKKKKKQSKLPRLAPIEEPTRYVACQIAGRLNTTKGANRLPGQGSVFSFQSGQSRSTQKEDTSSNPASRLTEEDEADNMEFRVASTQGHVVKLGVTSVNLRAVKYLGLEIPVMNNELQLGIRREAASERAAQQAAKEAVNAFSIGVGLGRGNDGLTPQPKTVRTKAKPRPVRNHQICVNCKQLARPHVVMDKEDKEDLVPIAKKPYTSWERAMLDELKLDGNKSVVILELGSDKRMDPCRKQSERLFKLTKNTQRSTLIRITQYPMDTKKGRGFGRDSESVVTIEEPPMSALQLIDRCMDKMRRK